jgi:hypothetical protein
VDLPDESIRGHGDNGKRANPLAALRMTPIFLKSSDAEGRAVLHGNGIGLLCSGSFNGSPLKEAFNGNDAAPLRVGRAEGR